MFDFTEERDSSVIEPTAELLPRTPHHNARRRPMQTDERASS